jgi:glyoxylase-like metal-dependent hydrolase (beta-lactamase superfamily II)
MGADLSLPLVEQVRPGLWTVPVPIPNSAQMGYVLVYAFETERGPYLVDAGWNTDDAYSCLVSGLAQAGFDITDVQGVIVTHMHPDHYGLAGRIREASGAWVGLHPADAALIGDHKQAPTGLMETTEEILRREGAPLHAIQALQHAAMPAFPEVAPALPDLLIEDGDQPEVPGWELTAVWTPGHSPGHLCLWEASQRLMLSGDHILPRITPHIGIHPQSGLNPLGDYVVSLEKVCAYDASEVMPAHEYRFVGLHRRVEELKAHHQARLDEVLAAMGAGAVTTWEIASHMTWSRAWDRIQGWMLRAALGETLAHLHYLQSLGRAYLQPGEPSEWVALDMPDRLRSRATPAI